MTVLLFLSNFLVFVATRKGPYETMYSVQRGNQCTHKRNDLRLLIKSPLLISLSKSSTIVNECSRFSSLSLKPFLISTDWTDVYI